MHNRTSFSIAVMIVLFLGVALLGPSCTLAVQAPAGSSSNPKIASDDGKEATADFPKDVSADRDAEIQQLKQRVAELEATQESLKAILFKTVKLQQQQAERRYQEVVTEYQNSERLQLQGILSAYQLDLDRFEMEKARLEWQLTEANFHAPELAAQIDLLESQRRLRVAQQQYLESKMKLAKGYLGPKLLERFQKALDSRKEEVNLQEQRLQAVREMIKTVPKDAAQDAEPNAVVPEDARPDAPAADAPASGTRSPVLEGNTVREASSTAASKE